MATLFPTESRIVQGYDRTQAVVSELIAKGVWVTVQPALQEGYIVTVKVEHADKLPPLKDWRVATAEELLQVANEVMPKSLGTTFGTRVVMDDAPDLARHEEGFWFSTRTFVPYPRDRS